LNEDYPAFFHSALDLAAPAEALAAPDNIITPDFAPEVAFEAAAPEEAASAVAAV